MSKGFTLVELLIVMVIIGVLATIAIPKYNASIERSRATEGITNLERLSSEANAIYELEGARPPSYTAQYPSDISSRIGINEIIKSNFFNAPTVTRNSANQLTVSIARKSGSGYSYTLSMVNSNGEPGDPTCSGTDCNIVNMNITKSN